MTWRAPADLIERVRRAARRQRRSMNDYVTAVLDAATNPRLAGSEAELTKLDRCLTNDVSRFNALCFDEGALAIVPAPPRS